MAVEMKLLLAVRVPSMLSFLGKAWIFFVLLLENIPLLLFEPCEIERCFFENVSPC